MKLAAPSSPTADLAKLAADPEANPIKLALELESASRGEWRDWLPETLRSFTGLRESDVAQLDKIMACQVVVTNPDVWDHWDLFLPVVIAFNHRRANFEWVDQPTFLELAWGVHCMHAVDKSAHTFHPDVCKFILTACMHDGLLLFPWSHPVLEVPGNPLLKGLATDLDEAAEVVTKLKKLIEHGLLEDAKLSDVDETDLFHAQAAKLVAAQEYINACLAATA